MESKSYFASYDQKDQTKFVDFNAYLISLIDVPGSHSTSTC